MQVDQAGHLEGTGAPDSVVTPQLSNAGRSKRGDVARNRRAYLVVVPLLVLLMLWVWLFDGEGAFKGGPGGKAFAGDYAMFVSAAQLTRSNADPYNPGLLIRTETQLLQQQQVPPIDPKQRSHVRVGNPPLLYWAMEPLIDRQFVPAALVALLSLYVLSALGFVAALRYFGWRRWFLPTLAFLLMPQVVLGVFYGNPVAIVFAAIGLSLPLSRRYPVLAGALLSVAWLKPPIGLPAVLLIALFLVSARARLLWGFVGATAALFLATVAATGPHSIVLWVRGLTRYSNEMSIQPDVISLNGLYVRWMPSGPRLGLEAITLAIAIALTAYYWRTRTGDPESMLRVAPLWVVWMLASPYGHFADEVILAIPVLALLGANGRRVTCPLPAIVVYLLFFSLLVLSWTPGGVHLLPIPLIAIAACLMLARRNVRYQVA